MSTLNDIVTGKMAYIASGRDFLERHIVRSGVAYEIVFGVGADKDDDELRWSARGLAMALIRTRKTTYDSSPYGEDHTVTTYKLRVSGKGRSAAWLGDDQIPDEIASEVRAALLVQSTAVKAALAAYDASLKIPYNERGAWWTKWQQAQRARQQAQITAAFGKGGPKLPPKLPK
jgi:hypothetical protein